MNGRKAAAAAGMALVCVALLLLYWRKPESAATQVSVTAVAAESAPASERTAEPPEPVPDPAPQVVPSAPDVWMFPSSPGAEIGFEARQTSADLETYLVFMDVGAASEIVNGGMRDEQSVRLTQRAYALTDEELARLVEHSRAALQADRSFQTRDQEAICQNRHNYQSIAQFGAALNEHTSRVEAHQESLGRNATTALGFDLHNRIRDRILSQPRGQMNHADFPVVLTRRNHGLATEIERFCNAGR